MFGNVNGSHDYFLPFGYKIGFSMCCHLIFPRKFIYKLRDLVNYKVSHNHNLKFTGNQNLFEQE
jgi:hypothetical protein